MLLRPSWALLDAPMVKNTAKSATASFRTIGVYPNFTPLDLRASKSMLSKPADMVDTTFICGPAKNKISIDIPCIVQAERQNEKCAQCNQERGNVIKDIHNSWLYCFTNPLELGTRQPNVLTHSVDVSQVQED